MLFPSQIVSTVIQRLKESGQFSKTVIFTEFDTNIDEKPNADVFIAVGLDSYYISEELDLKVDPAPSREYIANVKISFYGKYNNGAKKCYTLADTVIKIMLEKFKDAKLNSVKCSQAVYRRDVDSIVVDSVFGIKDFYYK